MSVSGSFAKQSLFCFFVRRMLAAPLAVATKLQPSGHVLLIFRRVVIAPLTFGARQRRLFLSHRLSKTPGS